jgi:peptidoglycan/LPS O-acetylase OafA/YrhL
MGERQHLPGHLPALDGVRGLAIALVFARHLSLLASVHESQHRLDRVVGAILSVGWIGVDLFFVLSGFLITGILIRERDRKASTGAKLRRFYWRRLLRILPLYYAMCAFLFFVLPHLPYFRSEAETATLTGNQLWYWLHGVNILETLRGGATPYNTGHFWSLAVEEQFYLVWPFIVLGVSRKTLWRVVVIAIVAGPLIRAVLLLLTGEHGPTAAYTLSVARVDVLGTGALVALITATPTLHQALRTVVPWVAGCSVVTLALVTIRAREFAETDPVMQLVGYTAIALLAGCLVAHAVHADDGSASMRILQWRVATTAGLYAYCLYVVHYPLMALLDLVRVRVPIPTVAGSHLPQWTAYATTLVVLSFAVAWVSWRVLESPMLALKTRRPQREPSTVPDVHTDIVSAASTPAPSTPVQCTPFDTPQSPAHQSRSTRLPP